MILSLKNHFLFIFFVNSYLVINTYKIKLDKLFSLSKSIKKKF